MKTIETILIGLLCASAADAQEDLPPARVGGYADYNRNLHDAGFTKLPGTPSCCPRYESGQGTGISFGALYDLPLSSLLSLQLRAGYATHGASLTTTEPTSVIVGGVTTPGAFEHRIDATLSNIGIEPLVGIRIDRDLQLHGGLRAGYVMARSFAQQETIIQPEASGTFIDSNGHDSKKRTRNESAGEIPDASDLYLALVGGVSYDLPIDRDRTMVLSPELFYAVGLNPVSRDLSWYASALRGGISFRYLIPEAGESALPSPFEVAETFSSDTLATEEHSLLTADITAVGVDRSGAEMPAATVRVEETVSSRLTPLLASIFFDERSGDLPRRYMQLAPAETDTFMIDRLHAMPTLSIYHHLLNIIGRRLTEHPTATITLRGCNAGTGSEESDTALSRRRAEAVREYLASVWRIAPERMTIEVRGLPARPATPIGNPEKMEENRRVEITSDLWQIVEPVETADTMRAIEMTSIHFNPRAITGEGIDRWSVTVSQQGRELRRFEFASLYLHQIVWDPLEEDVDHRPVAGIPLDYTFTLTDRSGRQITTPVQSIPVEQTTLGGRRFDTVDGVAVDRFALLLFEFDETGIGEAGRPVVELLRSRIAPGSVVTLRGYTDRTGDADRNLALSMERAHAVRTALGDSRVEATAAGEELLLYDNDTPEGRGYCRTVEVVVRR